LEFKGMPLIRILLRAALLVGGVVLGLAMMALAVLVMLAVLVWSLLRGRKPVVDLSGLRRARRHMGGGEVVDVEARDVTPGGAHQRLEDSSAKISP
jgi:hypothetical protein